MAKNKTTETQNNVEDFVNSISDDSRRNDFSQLVKIISKNTGLKPKMWGTSIVGFGSYHYKYESGREGDAPLVGMASRANAIVFYLCSDNDEKQKLLDKIGKYKMGKGCVYIQKLEDIDTAVLIKLVHNSIAHFQKKYPVT